MRAKKTYLFSLICFWIITLTGGLSAQSYLGVTWNAPEDTSQISTKLDSLQQLGIQYIELNHPASEVLLRKLDAYEFSVLIRSDISFLIASEVEQNSSEFEERLLEIVAIAESHPTVTAVGLLSNSLVEDADFNSAFAPILSSLSDQSSGSLYFVNASRWYAFESPSKPFGIWFDHTSHDENILHHLDNTFRNFTRSSTNQILFFEANWLLSATQEFPVLMNTLVEFKSSGQWLLPLPEKTPNGESANGLVLILLFLWIGLAIQMKYLPYVRDMVLRYLFAHRFFVDDILHYRERLTTGSILMMVAHAIFGGMTTYISARILISETGLEALFHHCPYLAIAGGNYFSLALAATIFILTTQAIAILWLHLPAKNLEHLSQTLNLYAGLFYLDFILITLMVPLFLTNTWPVLTLILAIVYVLVWFASFNISAFDASKSMGANRFIYLLITIGLHLIVFLAAITLLFTQQEIIEVISLTIGL